MILAIPKRELEFVLATVAINQNGISKLFANKNNKTLLETLKSHKYKHLSATVHQRYGDALNDKLGEFLYHLKINGDEFYRQFLNKYGDEVFCRFSISEHLKSMGLYCFVMGGAVTYIGRSHDPFGKRINQGYGNISPKNCYRDGQATNCHLNSLIAGHCEQLALYICTLTNDAEIDALEKVLIRQYQPEWNIALKT